MRHQLFRNKIHIVWGILFTVILGMFAGGTWTLLSRASAIIPKISIKKQDDSPLVISSAFVDSTDAFKPSYRYVITNISNKPIRAYAIRHDATFGKENAKSSGSTLSHLISIDLLLAPNMFRHEAEGNSTRYTSAVTEIELSIDFVEFADGSSWGDDYFKSAENLAGQRAGGKAAIKYFGEKIKLNGIDALNGEIEKENIILSNKLNTSKIWQHGFQTGVGIVRQRLKEANYKGSLDAIKQELEKPFDASEGRKQR